MNTDKNQVELKPCDHDYEKPIRLGRAHLVCRKCKKDITLEIVFMEEILNEGE